MFGLGTEDIVVLGAALGVFVVVLALSLAGARDGRVDARIRAVASIGARRSTTSKKERGETGKAAALDFMRNTVGRLNLVGSVQTKAMTNKLAQAGRRSKDALIVYLFARLALPVFAGGTALIAFYGLEIFALAPMFKLLAVVGCTVAGFFLPSLLVNNMITRRKHNLLRALPDTVDLMVICTEAGLSLDATLARVAKEVERSAPEMADEVTVVVSELAYLGERKQALENLKARVDLPPVHALCTTFLQTEKFGTPLAQALRVLAQEQRDERMLRAEEKAARLPAIMTIPLITCILPSLFVVVMGPAVLSIADALVKM